MATTKKSVRYRPGSTSGCNSCRRCVQYVKRTAFCDILEKPVSEENTCDNFEQDPQWKNPHANTLRRWREEQGGSS